MQKLLQTIYQKLKAKDYHVLIIYILYKILKNMHLKRLYQNATKTSDSDAVVPEGTSIIKLCCNFLEQNATNIEEWTDKNLYQYTFSVIDYWTKLKNGLSINEYEFKELISFCYNTDYSSLKTAAHIFLTEHYEELDVCHDIFPELFNLSRTQSPKINKSSPELVELFIEYFILINCKKGHIKTYSIEGTSDGFKCVNSISDLIGEYELWMIVYNTSNLEVLNRLSRFMNQIYKSCSLTASKIILKEMAHNFTIKFLTSAVEAVENKNISALNSILHVALYVINNITGIKLKDKASSHYISIKVYYKRHKDHVIVDLNTTFLGLIDHAKETFNKHKNLSVYVEEIEFNSLNMLEEITASIFDSTNFDERKVIFRDQSNFVDLYYYRDKILSILSNQKTFFTIIENLIKTENVELNEKVDALIKTFPPHKFYINYFYKALSDKREPLSTIMQYERNYLFDRYIQILLSIITRNNDNDCKDIIKLIKNKHLNNMYLLIIELKDCKRDPCDRTTNQLLLLDIIVKIVNFNFKFKIKKENVDMIFKTLIDLLKTIDRFGIIKKKNKNCLKIVARSLLVLNYVKALPLKTILEDIEKTVAELQETSNAFIIDLCEAINEYPSSSISWSELRTLIKENRERFFHSEYILVYLTIILKKYDDKKIVSEGCEELLKKYIKKILISKKTTSDSQIIILTIKILHKILLKYKNIDFNCNDEFISWIDFYIFRTNQTADKYSNYFYILDDDQNPQHVFNLIYVAFERKDLNANEIQQLLQKFVRYQKYRGNSQHNWNITEKIQALENNSKYRGLVNLGSTCYLNSCLQQLFMIGDFFSFITKLKINDTQSSLSKVNLLVAVDISDAR